MPEPKTGVASSNSKPRTENDHAAPLTPSRAPNPTSDPKSDPKPAATMAVEPPELDDFGLPIKKFKSPSPPEPETTAPNGATNRKASANANVTTSSAKVETSISEPAEPPRVTSTTTTTTTTTTQEGTESKDSESSSEDEFKDAVSAPQSGVASPVDDEDGKGNPKSALPASGAVASEKESDSLNEVEGKQQDSKMYTKATKTKAKPESSDPATPGETPATVTEKLPKEDKAISLAKETTKHESKAEHSREKSESGVAVGTGVVFSEFSHQQLMTKNEEKIVDDDGEWQAMPSYAPYDIYDDDNKLVAREYHEEEDEENQKYGYGGLGGAGKGYTRVFVDDDAESATSMDENTQYLFKDKGISTAVTDEDDVQRDAVSQLQATKELLTEGQRIAYVGLVRLEISGMLGEIEQVKPGKRAKKEWTTGAESMRMWSQKIMIRLYSHMDVNSAEQIMIEQLTAHGVMPADLTPVLMANARVKNPMAKKDEDEEKPASGSNSAKASRPTSAMSAHSEEQLATPPPAYMVDDSELTAPVKTPSQMPTTEKIDIDLRWTVLCDLFLVLIADSIYDSRSRVLLERVGKALEIPWLDICRFEKKATDALEMQQQAEKENWNEDDHMESRRKQALKRRYVMMGLATVGGGLVIGLSAGLLAPMIGAGLAAGFTTIGVAGTNTFLAGAGGAAIITSSAAASGSIIGGRAANRRTGAVKTFEYRPLHNNKRVNLIVTVSGWMTGKVDDVRLPFSTVDPVMGDLYSILWEPEMLRSMGDTINILATEALTQGLQQVLGSTILTVLMSALQLPVILTKLSYLIDNPWTVSLDRATSAGLILADSLIDRNLGTRPVTLVGYSIGSRVIFSCLQELARKGAYGLVQNVYLFGSPMVVKQDEYMRARSVVAGRFVNAYNVNDWILGYLFRLTGGGIRRVAGLAPIEGVPGIENMDVSEFVAGHMDYRRAVPRLLRECGWDIESDEFTEIEDPDPDNHAERQRELINEIEEARKEALKEQKEGKGAKGAFAFFRKKKAAEKQEWEVYEDSGKVRASGKTEDKEGNNHGVFFDIDAIRAELAKERLNSQNGAEEELLQIREIKSTLPPMKLDLSPSPPPAVRTPRDSLRETRSSEAVPYRTSGEDRSPGELRATQTHSRKPSITQRKVSTTHQRQSSSSHRASSERASTFPPTRPDPEHYPGLSDTPRANTTHDEIQMTFDTSFDQPAPKHKTPVPSHRVPDTDFSGTISQSRPVSLSMNPAVTFPADTPTIPARPDLISARTDPLPSAPPTNPWADFVDDEDDDFGKEQEISMTFA